jgi:hypothetical protein
MSLNGVIRVQSVVTNYAFKQGKRLNNCELGL